MSLAGSAVYAISRGDTSHLSYGEKSSHKKKKVKEEKLQKAEKKQTFKEWLYHTFISSEESDSSEEEIRKLSKDRVKEIKEDRKSKSKRIFARLGRVDGSNIGGYGL